MMNYGSSMISIYFKSILYHRNTVSLCKGVMVVDRRESTIKNHKVPVNIQNHFMSVGKPQDHCCDVIGRNNPQCTINSPEDHMHAVKSSQQYYGNIIVILRMANPKTCLLNLNYFVSDECLCMTHVNINNNNRSNNNKVWIILFCKAVAWPRVL